MGKLKFAVWAVMVTWSCGAYGQAEGAQDVVHCEARQESKQGTALASLSSPDDAVRQGAECGTKLLTDQNPGNDSATGPKVILDQQPTQPPDPQWFYGGFLDAA